jgi:hypothetical protein
MLYTNKQTASDKVAIDDVDFDSMVEAKWYVALKEMGFTPLRETIKFCKGTSLQYTPDFFLKYGCKTDRGEYEDCYIEVKDSIANFKQEDLERMNISIKTDPAAWNVWFILVGAIPSPITCREATPNFVAFKFDSSKYCYYFANARPVLKGNYGAEPKFIISCLMPDDIYGDLYSYRYTSLDSLRDHDIETETLLYYEHEGYGTHPNFCNAFSLAHALKEEDVRNAFDYYEMLDLADSHISSLWNVPKRYILEAEIATDLTETEVIRKILTKRYDAEIWNGNMCTTDQDYKNAAMHLLKRLYFWCNGRAYLIDDTFKQSPLYKDYLKAIWDEPTDSSLSYGDLSLLKAMNSTWETYAIWMATRDWTDKRSEELKKRCRS